MKRLCSREMILRPRKHYFSEKKSHCSACPYPSPFSCMEEYSLTGMKISPARRLYFAVYASADLTSFDIIWIPARADMGQGEPNKRAGLVPKTLKNPSLVIFIPYYSEFYTLHNWIPPALYWRQDMIQALWFMKPYALVIFTEARANHIYRKVITYTGLLTCHALTHNCFSLQTKKHKYTKHRRHTLFLLITLAHASLLLDEVFSNVSALSASDRLTFNLCNESFPMFFS